jgi:hypothetical protein
MNILIPSGGRICESASLFQLFLCLSRACLGKMINELLVQYGAEKDVSYGVHWRAVLVQLGGSTPIVPMPTRIRFRSR